MNISPEPWELRDSRIWSCEGNAQGLKDSVLVAQVFSDDGEAIILLRSYLGVKLRRSWWTIGESPGVWKVPQLLQIAMTLTDEALIKAATEAAYQKDHDVGLLTKAETWFKENVEFVSKDAAHIGGALG